MQLCGPAGAHQCPLEAILEYDADALRAVRELVVKEMSLPVSLPLYAGGKALERSWRLEEMVYSFFVSPTGLVKVAMLWRQVTLQDVVSPNWEVLRGNHFEGIGRQLHMHVCVQSPFSCDAQQPLVFTDFGKASYMSIYE